MDFSVLSTVATFLVVIGGFWLNSRKVQRAEALISQIRANDMHDLTERLGRIENKLDEHLAWHMPRA